MNALDHLTRYLDNLGGYVDALLQDAPPSVSTSTSHMQSTYRRECTVQKTKDLVKIKVAVPGCTPKDIKVSLARGILKVTYSPLMGALGGDPTHKFQVNPKVTMSDITATVREGLLTIEIKSDEIPESPAGEVPVKQG